jgi:hypothetical protein
MASVTVRGRQIGRLRASWLLFKESVLGQSLGVVLAHPFPLFGWAVITSTVGIVLRMFVERSQRLGKIALANFNRELLEGVLSHSDAVPAPPSPPSAVAS